MFRCDQVGKKPLHKRHTQDREQGRGCQDRTESRYFPVFQAFGKCAVCGKRIDTTENQHRELKRGQMAHIAECSPGKQNNDGTDVDKKRICCPPSHTSNPFCAKPYTVHRSDAAMSNTTPSPRPAARWLNSERRC